MGENTGLSLSYRSTGFTQPRIITHAISLIWKIYKTSKFHFLGEILKYVKKYHADHTIRKLFYDMYTIILKKPLYKVIILNLIT